MWFLNTDNPEAIQRLYDNQDGLERVELHEVVLQRDGPRLQLRFDLPRFPDHPPARWHPESNTVQVTLDLWGIEDLTLTGWGTHDVGELRLTRSNSTQHVAFEGAITRLTARFSIARVAKLSEYTNGNHDG